MPVKTGNLAPDLSGGDDPAFRRLVFVDVTRIILSFAPTPSAAKRWFTQEK